MFLEYCLDVHCKLYLNICSKLILSAVMDWELVCERKELRATAQAIFMTGVIIIIVNIITIVIKVIIVNIVVII